MELRRYTHSLLASPLHRGSDTGPANSTGTALESIKQSVSEMQPFVLIAICLGVLTVITVIVVLCCKKYYTRQLYQKSPEHFTSRPSLSLLQTLKFQESIPSLTKAEDHVIARKETYDGKFIEVTFLTNRNCIYFPNVLAVDCYFEIEAVKLSSIVQIGFCHKADIDQICKEAPGQPGEYLFNLDQLGVSVKTDGSVFNYGTNQINYSWKIEYGDTLGIGLTKDENSGTRRVWITKNGIIQNPPSQEEMIKYIDISKEKGKDKTTVKKKKHVEDEDELDEKKIKEKAEAAKRKIQIKTTKSFEYYALVISESPSEPRRQTILNWNVGGQSFRLYDAKELQGLLK